MLRTVVSVAALVAAAVVAAVAVLGPSDAARDAGMEEWVAELQTRTVPPGAKSLTRSKIDRSGCSAEVRWEFDAGLGWTAYREWLGGRLAPDFATRSDAGDVAEFHRHLPGDSNFLRVVSLSGGTPLRVRVIFTSRPD